MPVPRMLSLENKLLLRPKQEPNSVAGVHFAFRNQTSDRISVMKH